MLIPCFSSSYSLNVQRMLRGRLPDHLHIRRGSEAGGWLWWCPGVYWCQLSYGQMYIFNSTSTLWQILEWECHDSHKEIAACVKTTWLSSPGRPHQGRWANRGRYQYLAISSLVADIQRETPGKWLIRGLKKTGWLVIMMFYDLHTCLSWNSPWCLKMITIVRSA